MERALHQVAMSSAGALVHSSALAPLTQTLPAKNSAIREQSMCISPARSAGKPSSTSGLQSHNCSSASPKLQLNKFLTLMQVDAQLI